MKRILFYLLLVCITVYVEIMYDGFEGTAFLAFEILLFAACFLLSRYLKRIFSVKMKICIPAVQKGEEIKIELLAENRGVLPITKNKVWVAVQDSQGSRQMREEFRIPVAHHKTEKINCGVVAEYCGRLHFTISKGKVWDYLGMFSGRIKVDEEQYVNVLPGFHEMQVQVSEWTRKFSGDGESYDPNRSGDDVSEVFQIREFRDGDALQSVHWKLSAKSENLMVREFGRPVSAAVLLFFNLQGKGQKKETIPHLDAMMEIAAAISSSLWREEVSHVAAWFDESEGRMIRKMVKEEEQVYEMMDALLGARAYREERDLWELYQAEHPQEFFAVILQLDMNLRLFNGEKEVAVFETEKLREQLAEYVLEV